MILGFFGKGGSGKTTTCFQFLRSIHPAYSQTLAIDADHNMDLTFNIGTSEPIAYIGQSASELETYLNTASTFTLDPKDPFTKKYTQCTANDVDLMVSGPHTESIFQGDVCSHSLFKPVIRYLNHLERKPNQLVVVDNTAGMDAIGLGVPACLDVVIVCVEPTLHSLKVGRQLVEAIQRFKKPLIIVANKLQTREHLEMVERTFSEFPIAPLRFDTLFLHPDEPTNPEQRQTFEHLHSVIQKLV
jgi:CO dehydrogenase maturation factor